MIGEVPAGFVFVMLGLGVLVDAMRRLCLYARRKVYTRRDVVSVLAPTFFSDLATLVFVPPLSFYLAYVSAHLAAQEAVADDSPSGGRNNGDGDGGDGDGDLATVDNNHIASNLSDNRSSLNDPLLPPASAVGVGVGVGLGIGVGVDLDNTPPSPNLLPASLPTLPTDPFIQRSSEPDGTPVEPTVEICGLVKTFRKGGSRR